MDDMITCVECGRSFDVADSDYISESVNSACCPYCGRANYCELKEAHGLRVESMYDTCETDEPYTEDYFSKDLLYDGSRRKQSRYKHVGVAKQKSKMQLEEDLASGYIAPYFAGGKQAVVRDFLDNDFLPKKPKIGSVHKPMFENRPERSSDK